MKIDRKLLGESDGVGLGNGFRPDSYLCLHGHLIVYVPEYAQHTQTSPVPPRLLHQTTLHTSVSHTCEFPLDIFVSKLIGYLPQEQCVLGAGERTG